MAGYGVIQKDLRVLKELGYGSLIRGTDAAGLFETNSKDSKKTTERFFKTSEDWSYLLWKHTETREASLNVKSRMLDFISNDVYLGHTRWATVGDLSDENAQPFKHGNIVATHNGTVKMARYKHETKSDSDLFIKDISERGLTEPLRSLSSSDAYALVVYDSREKELLFSRNEHRTLFFAVNQERNVLYWASEIGLLRWILDRNGIKYSYENSSGIFGLKQGVVIKTKISDIKPKHDIFTEGDKIFEYVTENNRVFKRWHYSPTALISHSTSHAKIQNGKKFSVECNHCANSISLVEQYQMKQANIHDDWSQGFYSDHDDKYYCKVCMKTNENEQKKVS